MFFAPIIELLVVLALFIAKTAFFVATLPGQAVLLPTTLYRWHLTLSKRCTATPRFIHFLNQVAVIGGFLAAGWYLGPLVDAWDVLYEAIESLPEIFGDWRVHFDRIYFAPIPFFRALFSYPSWVWVLGAVAEGGFLVLLRLWDLSDAARKAGRKKPDAKPESKPETKPESSADTDGKSFFP